MNQDKQNWKTRACLIGIFGGAFCGSITAWATYSPIQKWLNALPHPWFVGQHTADVLSVIFAVLGVLVLPGLLSGLARRWTFLWGFLPLIFFLTALDLEDWVENGLNDVISSFWISLLVIGLCGAVSSGPVSLIRWLRVRGKRRDVARQAAYQAMREAASVPQEGVWPPPPNHTAQ